MDVAMLKDAARGRWRDIFLSAGIGDEFLTGSHGPCPKCGGKDRYRAADIEYGWLFCNQCFHAESGDGLATLQWFLGCDFTHACQVVADAVGYKEAKKGRKTLEERLEKHGELNEELASLFEHENPGITYLGLTRMGAINATHTSQQVVAFPCFGKTLKAVANYVVMSLLGHEVQLFDKHGTPTGTARKKTLEKGAGIMGAAAMPLLRTAGMVDVCWKTEGPTDLAALLSIIPEEKFASGEHIAVCNIHGALENPDWIAEVLATNAKVVHVIHDSDRPGQLGAAKWANAIALAGGTVKIVQLPYEVEEKHGKDLRDFVLECGDHAFARLLGLAVDVVPEVALSASPMDFIKEEVQLVLDRLAIDVLGELESGEILVYSAGTRKLTRFKAVDKIQRAGLIQAAGYAAMNEVAVQGEPSKDKLSLTDVRGAIALAASKRRVDANDFELLGSGIWQAAEGTVSLCNRRHLSIWDGTSWIKQETPRVSDSLFELGRLHWFDHEEIERLLPLAADPAWCEAVWQRAYGFFDRWTWKDQAASSGLLAALTGATLCQSVWRWRPQIAIIGASNTGKSALFEFLFGADGSRGLFGDLAKSFAMSSEAGIRQTIGRNSYAISIDEWDSLRPQRRRDIMNLLRTSGPASTVRLGTANHHAMEFGMRHIVWVAGVHCGMDTEVDQNRFLWFELLKPPLERYRAWKSPSYQERVQTFNDLLAICIRHASEARRLALAAFQSISVPGAHPRVIEGLAAPGALLAASTGLGLDGVGSLVERWATATQVDGEVQADESKMLEDILSLNLDKGGMQKVSAAEVLFKPDYCDSEYSKQVESQLGLAIHWKHDRKYLAVRTSVAAKRLQLDSGKSVSQVLSRLPGAVSSERVKIAGVQSRATIIPWPIVESACEDQDQERTNGQAVTDQF